MSVTDQPGAGPRWPDPRWTATALGSRVSVRCLAGVPGPTGGPGFRDVVGVLESVDPEGSQWSIRTRIGEVVRVDPNAVVAAKIVPDAPAQLRAAREIDVAQLEAIAARAWQPLEQEQLGDWLLRAAGGFTGRANSVLPLGDPGRPLDDALVAVRDWYAQRSLQPLIQVPLPLRSGLNDQLAQRGWEPYNEVRVMVCDISRLLMESSGISSSVDATISTTQLPDAAWLDAFQYGDAKIPAAVIPIVTKTDHPVFVSAQGPDQQTIAIARGAIIGRWLGITAIEVSAPYRRQGLGGSMIAALAGYGAAQRCRHVFLQVARVNVGARALYERLGFTAHHDYIYRRIG